VYIVTRSSTTPTRPRATRPLAQLLLDAVDDEVRGTVSATAYESVDADALQAAGFVHRISPAVYVHLQQAGDAPAELLEPMLWQYRAQLARHLQVLTDLAHLATTLGDAGIAWAAMKGPVLAERLWSRPDLRMYFDLDILVDRRSFGDAIEVLVDAGSEMVDQNWSLIEQQTRAEVSMRLPNGAKLDLHWHLVNDRRQRSQFRFPIAEMLSRSVKAELGGTTAVTLDPADTLLHLAYHTAHSGAHCLMWLKDVERATADPDLDWARTLHRARVYGVALPLAIVLARTARVIGFEVVPPAAALAPARRSGWGLLAAAVDRWRPPPMLPDDKHPAQMPFKNVRTSTLASVRPTLSWLRERRIPPDDPGVGAQDIAGDVARASYLSLLQRGREP
jgi:hypothetical protein